MNLSALMNKVVGNEGFGKRWAYLGSLTIPPCLASSESKVYWNVVQRVYPIKQKHLKLLNSKLSSDYLD